MPRVAVLVFIFLSACRPVRENLTCRIDTARESDSCIWPDNPEQRGRSKRKLRRRDRQTLKRRAYHFGGKVHVPGRLDLEFAVSEPQKEKTWSISFPKRRRDGKTAWQR